MLSTNIIFTIFFSISTRRFTNIGRREVGHEERSHQEFRFKKIIENTSNIQFIQNSDVYHI